MNLCEMQNKWRNLFAVVITSLNGCLFHSHELVFRFGNLAISKVVSHSVIPAVIGCYELCIAADWDIKLFDLVVMVRNARIQYSIIKKAVLLQIAKKNRANINEYGLSNVSSCNGV